MLNEKVLDDPIFDSTDDLDEIFFHAVEKELAKRGVFYPSFVDFEPSQENPKVSWHADTSTYSVEGMEQRWTSLATLAKEINELGYDIYLTSELEESPEVDFIAGQMAFLTVNHGDGEMVFGKSEGRELEINNYYGFLRTAKSWMQHQDDVVLAYSFLQYHPAFWYRYTHANGSQSWVTDDGMKSLWTNPAYHEGKLVVMLELGSAIPPQRVNHYREHRLDVWGTSFEDAYIQLAKKVHKFYSLDGEERKDVVHPLTAVEAKVLERLATAKETHQE